MFRFGGGEGGISPVSCLSVKVSQSICTRVDHQSVSSIIEKDLHKINDVIVLRPLSFVQEYTKQKTLKIQEIPLLIVISQ